MWDVWLVTVKRWGHWNTHFSTQWDLIGLFLYNRWLIGCNIFQGLVPLLRVVCCLLWVDLCPLVSELAYWVHVKHTYISASTHSSIFQRYELQVYTKLNLRMLMLYCVISRHYRISMCSQKKLILCTCESQRTFFF